MTSALKAPLYLIVIALTAVLTFSLLNGLIPEYIAIVSAMALFTAFVLIDAI